MSDLSVIVLAAGKGTRMKSPLPKVLHPVAGRPMISRIVGTLQAMGAEEISVIVGYGEKLLRQVLEPLGVSCCYQAEQKGTAHAVSCANPLSFSDNVLILNGDHPLIGRRHLEKVYQEFLDSKADIAVVSAVLEDGKSFGRIVRHQGQLRAIVEVKDASASTLEIKEVNTGIYFVKKKYLRPIYPKLAITISRVSIISPTLSLLLLMAAAKRKQFRGMFLCLLESTRKESWPWRRRRYFAKKRCSLWMRGSSLSILRMSISKNKFRWRRVDDPSRLLSPGNDFHRSLFCFRAQCFYPRQPNWSKRPGARRLLSRGVKVQNGAQLGPYARLRPGTEIGEDAKVGNFVEMKKTQFGKGAKAGHLTYLGDAEIGENTNIGCGTITCNYAADRKKYKTKIGSNVFVAVILSLSLLSRLAMTRLSPRDRRLRKMFPMELWPLPVDDRKTKRALLKNLRGKIKCVELSDIMASRKQKKLFWMDYEN